MFWRWIFFLFANFEKLRDFLSRDSEEVNQDEIGRFSPDFRFALLNFGNLTKDSKLS